MKILITGASGWLGRNSIRYFLKNGIMLNDLILVGSRNREIQVDKNLRVKIITFEEIQYLIKNNELSGIVHLAYLTKDYSKQNIESYLNINLELTKKIERIINLYSPRWFVYVSSGAIYSNYKNQIIETNLQKNPYGFLKNKDEIKFEEICKSLDINLTIGRLWGSMGIDFIHAKKYAVGEFIINTLTGKDIFINSNRTVYRTYCDSEQFIQMCIQSANLFKFTVFDSNGEVVEVEELAYRVKKLLKNKINIYRNKINESLDIDDYFSRNETFFELSKKLNLKLISLDEQIIKTAHYIKNNLNIFTY